MNVKRFLLFGLLALSLGSMARAGELVPSMDNPEFYKAGVRVLSEAMTPEEKDFRYSPHRDAGHAALKVKEFDKASQEYIKAGKATAFAWVRARQFANAAFALARASRCKESIAWYNEALKVQKLAEAKSSGGNKWAKSRAKCGADIEWGLKKSACREAE